MGCGNPSRIEVDTDASASPQGRDPNVVPSDKSDSARATQKYEQKETQGNQRSLDVIAKGVAHSTAKDKSGISGDPSFPPKTVEDEKKLIMNRTLRCSNCESLDEIVHVWCMECYFEDDNPEDPFVLCKSCDVQMHKPAKMSKHKREPFGQTYQELTKDEVLACTGKPMPAGAAKIVHIQCRNCEAVPVTKWCGNCHTMLCEECSRDFHRPQRYRDHKRRDLRWRYAVHGYINHRFASQMFKKSGAHGAAAKKGGAATRVNSTEFKGSTLPKIAEDTKSSVSLPSSPVATRTAPMPGLMSTTKSVTMSKQSVEDILAEDDEDEKVTPAPAKRAHIAAVANAGTPGDVIKLLQPDLEGETATEQLNIYNNYNGFDVFGAVQIVQISCGKRHAGAVTQMGTLFMWGSNVELQLGMDAGAEKQLDEPTLMKFPDEIPIKQVACGWVHTVALSQDGRVYSWGTGLMGILGHPTDRNCDRPMEVRGFNQPDEKGGKEVITYVACGQYNSGCLVTGRADKAQLYTWGANNHGQLATGDITPSLTPVLAKVEGEGKDFPVLVDLSFGNSHALAVTTNGDLYSWGNNEFGQCGYPLDAGAADKDKDAQVQLTPKLVPAFTKAGVKVKIVRCGERVTNVVDHNGDLWGFGSGESHQVGVMNNIDQFTPLRVATLGDKKGQVAENKVLDVSVGDGLSAAVTESGDIWMWGYALETPVPRKISSSGGHYIQKIAVGSYDCCFVLTGVANEVYNWVYSADDEDEGKGPDKPQLNTHLRGKRLRTVAAGRSHFCAVLADGKVLAWGSNEEGQLGVGADSPIDIMDIPVELNFSKVEIKDVRCSHDHSIALASDGRLFTWGSGAVGKLGHGKDIDLGIPTLIESMAKLKCIAVAIGPGNTGCITAEGTAYMWGAGSHGQIGNDDNHPQFSPVAIEGIEEELVRLAIGDKHAAALSNKGTCYTWGDNGFFQCGLGYEMSEPLYASPQVVEKLRDKFMVDLDCGENMTLCVSTAGEVYAWGQGETKQMGVPDSSEDVSSPIRITFPFEKDKSDEKKKGNKPIIKHVFANSGINCAALTQHGHLYVWGWAFTEQPQLQKDLALADVVARQVSCGGSTMLIAS